MLQKITGNGSGGIKKIRAATTFPETATGSGRGTADATERDFRDRHGTLSTRTKRNAGASGLSASVTEEPREVRARDLLFFVG